MNYFIISFSVTLDGVHLHHASTGTTTEFVPHILKHKMQEKYKKAYPHVENIDIVITETQQVPEDKYLAASKDFVEIMVD